MFSKTSKTMSQLVSSEVRLCSAQLRSCTGEINKCNTTVTSYSIQLPSVRSYSSQVCLWSCKMRLCERQMRLSSAQVPQMRLYGFSEKFRSKSMRLSGGKMRLSGDQMRLYNDQVRLGGAQVRLGGAQVRFYNDQKRLCGDQVRLGGDQVTLCRPPMRLNDAQVRFCSTQTRPKTGIVMLNMGGPDNLSGVADYLHQIMTDRDMIQLPFAQDFLGPWIARRRTADVQKKYQEIGGGSPILNWTNRQGALLSQRLDQVSPSSGPHKHYVAFRYVPPTTAQAFDTLLQDGVRHAILMSQYPQYSCATSGSSYNAIYQHFQKVPLPQDFRISVIDRYPTHPLLVSCFADLIRTELSKFRKCDPKQVMILFSAHSLPLKTVNRGDSYPSEVGATVQLIMEALKYSNPYQLVWQSKVGPLPWLGPFTDEALKKYVEKGIKNFVVVPVAFVNEHIETLHELDIEYCAELAGEIGVEEIRRVPSPNDHPMFIGALTDLVQRHLADGVPVSPKFLNRCPHCENARCYQSKKWFGEVCRI